MRKIILILLPLLFLAGCSGNGIFYQLENEEKIVDANNLKGTTALRDMLVYDDQYVINGKSVWHSTIGEDTRHWHSYGVPSKYQGDATFPSIAVMNGNLYASIISHDADYRSGLLKYNSSTGEWDELFFTKKSGSNYDCLYLFDTNQGLYLNVVNYYNNDSEVSINSSSLYFYSGDNAGETALAAGLSSDYLVTFPGFELDSSDDDPMPIVDIISAEASESYMIYNLEGSNFNNGVICYSESDPATFVQQSIGFDDLNFTDIYYSPAHDMLFMGTQADDDEHPVLYETEGTWYSEVWDNDVQFTSFCDISPIQTDTILAGTQAFKDPTSSSSVTGDGYIEIIVTNKTDPVFQNNDFSDDNNYNSSELEDATIKNFLYDETYDRLYAVTSSYGLWLNTADGSSREWAQE